jgi:hypothetical protein
MGADHLHAYADRIVIRQKGRVVAEHARAFRRGATIFNPWHYVPVLVRKPGALRNGAPFKDWVLPGAIERARRELAGSDEGDRQMVHTPKWLPTHGFAHRSLPAYPRGDGEHLTKNQSPR